MHRTASELLCLLLFLWQMVCMQASMSRCMSLDAVRVLGASVLRINCVNNCLIGLYCSHDVSDADACHFVKHFHFYRARWS